MAVEIRVLSLLESLEAQKNGLMAQIRKVRAERKFLSELVNTLTKERRHLSRCDMTTATVENSIRESLKRLSQMGVDVPDSVDPSKDVLKVK